ncbi:MAG: Fic family protein, partial [Acidobacteria bacterium]|nr:Fic family protein [Acidobacteriota bacterium]
QTGKNLGVPVEDIRPQLINLVADATVWFSESAADLVPDLALFHHRLVWIHPFANGNGRHARLATDTLARTAGSDLPRWGSESLDPPSQTRTSYIAALRAADNNDLAPLVVFLRGQRQSDCYAASGWPVASYRDLLPATCDWRRRPTRPPSPRPTPQTAAARPACCTAGHRIRRTPAEPHTAVAVDTPLWSPGHRPIRAAA